MVSHIQKQPSPVPGGQSYLPLTLTGLDSPREALCLSTLLGPVP